MTDPRIRQLAQAVHELARQKATKLPSWKDLSLSEREKVTVEAKLWLGAAVEAGIMPPAERPPDRAGLREQIAAKLWAVAEHTIVAEWICCDPIDPKHDLCVQGDATLRMVKALLVGDPEARKPNAPLLDAVLAVLPASVDRAAVYRELADRQTQLAVADDLQRDRAMATARRRLVKELRRLAVEARITGTTAPAGDEDCERCEGTGLDPDAYFQHGDTWTHAPCSSCQPEDDETAQRRAAAAGPAGGAQRPKEARR